MANQNWIQNSKPTYLKKVATKALNKVKKEEKQNEYKYVDHPTIPKTKIRVKI